MEQIVAIKKISVDSELKVSVTVEFIASNKEAKNNVFDLIQMQEDAVYATFTPSQNTLFESQTQTEAEAETYN